jgi:hypothetical protein
VHNFQHLLPPPSPPPRFLVSYVTLEIFNEHSSVESCESIGDPEKIHSFQSPGGGALEESNNHSPIGIYSLLPVSDWVDSLIDGWGWKKSWYAN